MASTTAGDPLIKGHATSLLWVLTCNRQVYTGRVCRSPMPGSITLPQPPQWLGGDGGNTVSSCMQTLCAKCPFLSNNTLIYWSFTLLFTKQYKCYILVEDIIQVDVHDDEQEYSLVFLRSSTRSSSSCRIHYCLSKWRRYRDAWYTA